MSSHHIVREDQEPALIIEDIDAVTPTQLDQLLEWSPIVIIHDQNLDSLVELGIKIDVLITDSEQDPAQDQILVLPLMGTFLDTALAYLMEKDCRAANILSNVTNPDSLFNAMGRLTVILLGNGQRIFIAKSGFRKWEPQGEMIRIYGSAAVAATVGLIKKDAQHYLTEKDGFYEIQFTGNHGLIGECL